MTAKKSAALHSKASPEWFTPEAYVAAARLVLGKFDVDPASCEEANRVVQADRYYDERSNGLSEANPWGRRVFLNPPGGKTPDGTSLVAAFWQRLIAELQGGTVLAAIWIGYSIEQLQTLQRFPYSPIDFPICIPRRRIAFDAPGGAEKNSPTHGNFISLVSFGSLDWTSTQKRFADVFSSFGAVKL